MGRTKLILVILCCISILACKVSERTTEKIVGEGRILIHSVVSDVGSQTVKGELVDIATGEGVSYAFISLSNEASGTIDHLVNSDGKFDFNQVAEGLYTLEINTQDGMYQPITTQLKIVPGRDLTLTIKMAERVIQVEKPVIYLYPEYRQEVSVRMEYEGTLTCTYPAYPEDGWTVTADPDGTLHDEIGMEYYALYWEGRPDNLMLPTDGLVVPGSETAAFLEEKLAFFGLSRREANEFIMYWLPRMEGHPYNLIHFADGPKGGLAKLNIDPAPETLIRVMMLTQPLQSAVDFPLQDISGMSKIRHGFTVVEWGGSEVRVIREEN
ncbi:MAG: carboxypeptidase regulatory-like domain-containing protein [Flavobacteriales bacterium]|nr:carboxypeptidase regulatory-like domain-containing protein [Flavobacteriales bacterium]